MKKPSISRRNFLRNAAVSAAGALVAPYVLTSTALGKKVAGRVIPPASERVVLGHIGVGGQGSGLLGQFLNVSEAQCVAACDCFPHKREAAAARMDAQYGTKGAKAYADFRELLARPDIDAVVIATPDHWHVGVGVTAARAGKDTYIEKPLGISIAHNKAMRDAIHRYGRVFQYGTQQRSSAHMRLACELVRSGRVGKVHTVHVVAPDGAIGGKDAPLPVPEGLNYDLYLGNSPWRPYCESICTNGGSYHYSGFAIGFIAGWGAHPLDIADWGLNGLAPVEFEGTGKFGTSGLYDTCYNWDVRITMADGVKMTFKPGRDLTTFVGDKGQVAVGRGSGCHTIPVTLRDVPIGPGDTHLTVSTNHYANYVHCVKTRTQPISDIDSAFRSDAISHLSLIAIKTGRKIKWDPKREEIIGDPEASRLLSRACREPWEL